MKRKWLILSGVLTVFLVAVGIFLNFRILTEVEIEAGETVRAEAFARFTFDKERIRFTEGSMEGYNADTLGVWQTKATVWPVTKTVRIHVVDTTAPSAQAVTVSGRAGQELEPEEFVENVTDTTGVTVQFEQTPDFTLYGEQEVSILLTDSAGNTARVTSVLKLANLKASVTIEAGSKVPEAESFLIEAGTAVYASDVKEIDTSHTGTYEVSVTADGITASADLIVADTVPPEVTVSKISSWTGKEIRAAQFAVSTEDATEVTAVYREAPDFSKEGEGSAFVLFTDEGGNAVEKQVFYTLKKDTQAPEVAVSGIDVTLGGNISYKKAVNFSDNADSREELILEVDKSKVDVSALGTYNVTYTVTDTSGNRTVVQGVVNVLEEEPDCYNEELVNNKADEVLEKILTEDMTQKEQVKAIYTWIRQNIGYVNHSEKGEWVRAAYEGLYKHQGDCYVYACTAKALLTRAGIPNLDIVKLTVNPSHYWNLVDVGDGWYHFDTTPRKDKSVFFLVTDEELREYSQANNNSHAYDESLYPEIN